MAFRIQIALPEAQFDDSFYFKEFPTKTQLLEAIEKNRKIADKYYNDDYDACMNGIEGWKDYPDTISSRVAMIGSPLEFGASISIWQFSFCD